MKISTIPTIIQYGIPSNGDDKTIQFKRKLVSEGVHCMAENSQTAWRYVLGGIE